MSSPKSVPTNLSTEVQRTRYWPLAAALTAGMVVLIVVAVLLLEIPQFLQTIVLFIVPSVTFLLGWVVAKRVEPDVFAKTVYQLPETATVKRSKTTNSALEYRYHITFEADDVIWSYTGFKKPMDDTVRVTEWSSGPSVFATHNRSRVKHDSYVHIAPSGVYIRFSSVLHETPRD